MNKYICFWKDRKVEVEAETSYGAQQKAVQVLQSQLRRTKVKEYDVHVWLAEKDGEQVVHSTGGL